MNQGQPETNPNQRSERDLNPGQPHANPTPLLLDNTASLPWLLSFVFNNSFVSFVFFYFDSLFAKRLWRCRYWNLKIGSTRSSLIHRDQSLRRRRRPADFVTRVVLFVCFTRHLVCLFYWATLPRRKEHEHDSRSFARCSTLPYPDQKDQTTTPGTTCPTLYDKCAGSFTSHRIMNIEGL